MKKSEMKRFYEKFHRREIKNPVDDFIQKERCIYLRSLMKDTTGKVLIIGCGSNYDMSIINKKQEGVGIDISETAIKKSKEKYPMFKYCLADATKLPFHSNEFDCVVCSEVIEHIAENEKVFSEVKRVLRNNGVFLITCPNWLSWYGLLRKIAEKLLKRPFTAADQPIDNWFTPFGLKIKLEKYGFKVVLFRGLWYYPPTGKGRKQIPWRITLPIIRLFHPLEVFLRVAVPWFGHMILFKTKVVKNGK